MGQALATANEAKAAIIERVMVEGDLSKLSPQERSAYYMRTCESLGLNPMTRPFEYIVLNGKLTLYARKDCADQLRKRDGISIDKPDIQFQDDLIIVVVAARTPEGRTDSDIGVVKKSDMRGDVANALMKAVTKGKRRVTLSICGLGMLDETEVETIPDAQRWHEPATPVMKQAEAIPHTNGKATTPPPPDEEFRSSKREDAKARIVKWGNAAKEIPAGSPEDSVVALGAAVVKARVLYTDPQATIADLHRAADAIKAAVLALQPKPDEQPEPFNDDAAVVPAE